MTEILQILGWTIYGIFLLVIVLPTMFRLCNYYWNKGRNEAKLEYLSQLSKLGQKGEKNG